MAAAAASCRGGGGVLRHVGRGALYGARDAWLPAQGRGGLSTGVPMSRF
jgi:hypothetical protein